MYVSALHSKTCWIIFGSSVEIRLFFHFNQLQELEERIKDVRGEEEETESTASSCENLLEKLPVLFHNVAYKFLMHQVTI
jgi:hypothetical protein